MPAMTLNGHQIYYESSGSGDPVLLLPGLGGSAASFARQVGPLSERFQVVTYDHLGVGRSARPRISYSVDGMADDVIALMDGLGIESAHLVGHSTGGAIAQTIACTRPERVRRMVLLSSWPKADDFFRYVFAMRKDVLLGLGVEAYLRSTALFLYPPWWIVANLPLIEQRVKDGVAEKPDPDILASRIDAILRFDRTRDLPNVKTPTLVLCARDDTLTPPHFSKQIASLIPGARLIRFEDGGHAAHQTSPGLVNPEVIGFLS